MDPHTLLRSAQEQHHERPEAVADELALAAPAMPAALVPDFARLVTHLYGEHLGRWQAGIELLAATPVDAAAPGGLEARRALVLGEAVLRHAAGLDHLLEHLDTEARVQVLARASARSAGDPSGRPGWANSMAWA